MRFGLTVIIFSLCLAAAQAQEQERKLLDRILKPDTTLQSPEQQKLFSASGEVLTKKAPTRWFFFRHRLLEKDYPAVDAFQTREFATGQSRLARQQASTSTRTQLSKVNEPYRTRVYDTRSARDSGRVSATRHYPGVRSFVADGKSQKTLSAKDHPMTIDEVRELLNKNK